ncbi:MAG: threonine-phosphate decarboxylase [Syntrophus sp. (in: bacteria)]|nr:threonine-phosphate decarboxylase [Syntrophus sp. (in: bacteria)]
MTTFGHGGNVKQLAEISGRSPGDVLDFSANINPLGPPEWAPSLIQARFRDIQHYPDPDCSSLIENIAARYGVGRDQVIVGNGSTEILYLLPRVLPAGPVVIPVPSYIDYTSVVRLSGLSLKTIPLKEENAFKPDMDDIDALLAEHGVVFLGQPNNPTGMLYEASALRVLARKHPSAWFIVDEAFADFVDDMDSLTGDRPPNVVVLLSLTKIFAIPGIRLGCAVADAEMIRRLKAIQPPWSVNAIAQMVGERALQDREYLEKSRSYVTGQRTRLIEGLRRMGCFTVYPGAANFLLLRIDRTGIDAAFIAAKLLADGIAVRRCQNFEGLDDRFFRIAVRTQEENLKLLASLEKIIN